MCVFVALFLFFFFKQKTAYEMRISDWSSDVCSSDLTATCGQSSSAAIAAQKARQRACSESAGSSISCHQISAIPGKLHSGQREIGRASCRERVCQYV